MRARPSFTSSFETPLAPEAGRGEQEMPTEEWMARRQLARQARRDLLWWALGFATFQLGLALAVERWLADVRDPEFAAKVARLQARRAEAPDRPLVLML